MKLNIENCANMAYRARTKKQVNGHLYVIVEMVKNLKMVRDGAMDGNLEPLDKFFSIYTFCDDVEYVPNYTVEENHETD